MFYQGEVRLSRWLFSLIIIASVLLGSLAGCVAVSVEPGRWFAPAATPTTAASPESLPVLQAAGRSPEAAVAKAVGPAVVTVVNTQGRDIFGRVAEARGSGVIVDQEGHILTNAHVVAGQRGLEVIFADGRKVTAKMVGSDDSADVAVIQVEGSVPAVAVLGDSSQLEVGERVVAIGSALGDFRNTVTAGVISGLNRQLGDETSPVEAGEGYIQTDAAINHGNSGGPLIDLDGRVIGINTAIIRSGGGDIAEGLGFAIPINTAKAVMAEILAHGSVRRPYLGITYQPISPQIAAYYNLPVQEGLLILSVVSGSPAARAGLRRGDIVVSMDGTTITASRPLANIMLKYKPGDKVTLTILRDNRQLQVQVTLGEAQG